MPFLRFHPQNGTFLELSPSDFQTAIQEPKRRPTASHPNRQTNRAQDVLVITGDYTPFDIRVHITQRAAPGVENFPRTDRHGGMCPAKSCRPHRRCHSPRASGSMRQDHERHGPASSGILSRVWAVPDGSTNTIFYHAYSLARVGGTRREICRSLKVTRKYSLARVGGPYLQFDIF